MSDAREEILARVSAALAPLPKRAELPNWEREWVIARGWAVGGVGGTDAVVGDPGYIASGDAAKKPDVWALFEARWRAVNGIAMRSVEELIAYLRSQGARQGYCDPQLWPEFQSYFPADFQVELKFDRDRIDDYTFALTRSDGAIAETGTIILCDRTTSRRLAALAPWTHVAVVRRNQIYPDLPAAMDALPPDPNIIWVTGPSKTADVEGILIEGVHGPGRQIALIL